MVILPEADAAEFRTYCERNPKPCPILDVLPAGDPEPKGIAPGADVRTDLPRYRVLRNGMLIAAPTDVRDVWRDDLVTFLLGCSFIAEDALMKAGLSLPHLTETGFVPMYRTQIAIMPAGRFKGPMVLNRNRKKRVGEACGRRKLFWLSKLTRVEIVLDHSRACNGPLPQNRQGH